LRTPSKNGPLRSEGAVLAEYLTLTDLLQTVSGVIGWSKPVMVELRGFEPLTFCMPCTHVLSRAVRLGLLCEVGALRQSEMVALSLAETDAIVTS
jgi:hypothetical protein